MAGKKTFTLEVAIGGKINPSLAASVKGAKAVLNGFNGAFTTLDAGYNSIMRVGKKAFKTITVAAAAAAAATVSLGKDVIEAGENMETAFAGVRKTVKATEDEYAQLKQDIIDISKKTPSTFEEIAFVAETAGQLGIATDAISDFTDVMVNLGNVSNDLSAEEAATNFAKFANITGMADFDETGTSNWARLGSTVARLGNSFATTEGSITEMSLKLAATGKLVGLNTPEIMALSAAMSSTGQSASIGGNNMSKVLKKIQLAVKTNSSELEDWADIAGMTSEEFSELFNDSAAQAITKVIGGLHEQGDDAVATLQDLGITEMRTSNMLLALAGGYDTLEEAMGMANEAWDENTAIAEMAATKYDTLAAQSQIFQNTLAETKDILYQNLKDPLRDVVEWAQEKLQGFNDFLAGSGGIKKWISDINYMLPTLKRKLTTGLSGPLGIVKDALAWIVKNKNTLIGVVVGIGSALATYKIGHTVNDVIQSVMSFAKSGVFGLIIGAATALVGVLVGVGTALHAINEEAKSKDLAEHFGNIRLNMSELQAVAEDILGSDSLSLVKEALSEYSELDTASDAINDLTGELNKFAWKVNLGLDLSDEEKEEYQNSLLEFVNQMNEYAVNSQYAVHLNLEWSMNGNPTMQSKIENIYGDMVAEMQKLGYDLADMVNEAFSDGLLTPDEIAEMAEIQQKMAELKRIMATSESEAVYALIGDKYSGLTNLDSESFLNMQNELNEQLTKDEESFRSAYVDAVAAAEAAHAYNPTKFTDEDLQLAKDTAYENYRTDMGNEMLRSAEVQYNTLVSAYGNEINTIWGAIQDRIKEIAETGQYESFDQYISETQNNWGAEFYNLMAKAGISTAQFDNISDIFNGMGVTIDGLKELAAQYETAGKEIPESIQNMLDAMELLGDTVDMEDQFSESGRDMLNALFAGAQEAIEQGGSAARVRIEEIITQPMTTTIPVNVRVKPNSVDVSETANKVRSTIINNIGYAASNLQVTPDYNATGNIITSPTLSWVAEDVPEAIIPLENTPRSQKLLEMTERYVNMDSRVGGDVPTAPAPVITYNPTINFNGDAPSKEDMVSAMRMSQDEFERMMKQYLKNQSRFAF